MSGHRVIDLPVPYTIRYAEPGKRKIQSALVRSRVAVAIPEPDPEEVSGAWTLKRGKDGALHTSRVVSFEGRRYVALGGAPDADLGPVLKPGQEPTLRYLQRLGRPEGALERIPEVEEFLGRGDARKRVREDDLEAATALAVGDYVDSLIVHEGVLWGSHRVQEPYWIVGYQSDGTGVRVRVDLASGHADERSHAERDRHPFRADRLDEALAFAGHLAARHEACPVIMTQSSLVLHDPASLRHDDIVLAAQFVRAVKGEEMARWLASRIADWGAERYLPVMAMSRIHVRARDRSAIERVPDRVTPEEAGAYLEALAKVHEAFRDFDLRSAPEVDNLLFDTLLVAERWRRIERGRDDDPDPDEQAFASLGL